MSDRTMTSGAFVEDHGDAWRGRLVALHGAVRSAWRRHATRQRIAMLDSHDLRDIGVSYAEAEAEANKPFWRG
jgi:uncharacterized protein YjiS (DUF1127 family)